MQQTLKHKLKVVLLGDRAVGKSSIIKRFITNQFEQNSQPTVGVDFMAKNIRYQNQVYKMQLWDTAGQQKYRSLVKGYLKGADACIFVYDCTNIQTYTHITQWMNMFDSVAKNDAFSIIVGNKCESDFNLEALENQKEEYRMHKKELQNIYQVMSSAKLGINISEIFEEILENYIKKHKELAQNKTILSNNIHKISCCQV